MVFHVDSFCINSMGIGKVIASAPSDSFIVVLGSKEFIEVHTRLILSHCIIQYLVGLRCKWSQNFAKSVNDNV